MPVAPYSGIGGIGVQQPVGMPPDVEAIRRRLIGSVPGANNLAGMPYNAGFDRGVQDLYSGSMARLTGLDQQEGDINSQYEKNRGYQQQAQQSDTRGLMDRLAFNGILNSGIATDERAKLGQQYAKTYDDMAAQRANALREIANQRLGIQGDYNKNLGDLENNYTGSIAQWVQNQAQQQAARQQQQAQDQANNSLRQQLAQIQQQGTQSQLDLIRQLMGQG